MFRNNLAIAFRLLLRHKLHSLISLCSLTLGITCFAAISLFVAHELSYDRYHQRAESFYRLVFHIHHTSTDWACGPGAPWRKKR